MTTINEFIFGCVNLQIEACSERIERLERQGVADPKLRQCVLEVFQKLAKDLTEQNHVFIDERIDHFINANTIEVLQQHRLTSVMKALVEDLCGASLPKYCLDGAGQGNEELPIEQRNLIQQGMHQGVVLKLEEVIKTLSQPSTVPADEQELLSRKRKAFEAQIEESINKRRRELGEKLQILAEGDSFNAEMYSEVLSLCRQLIGKGELCYVMEKIKDRHNIIDKLITACLSQEEYHIVHDILDGITEGHVRDDMILSSLGHIDDPGEDAYWLLEKITDLHKQFDATIHILEAFSHEDNVEEDRLDKAAPILLRLIPTTAEQHAQRDARLEDIGMHYIGIYQPDKAYMLAKEINDVDIRDSVLEEVAALYRLQLNYPRAQWVTHQIADETLRSNNTERNSRMIVSKINDLEAIISTVEG